MPFMAMLVSGAFTGGAGQQNDIDDHPEMVCCTRRAAVDSQVRLDFRRMPFRRKHHSHLCDRFPERCGVLAPWDHLWVVDAGLGLVYGEFRGSLRRAYVALFLAIALYLIGTYLIANATA